MSKAAGGVVARWRKAPLLFPDADAPAKRKQPDAAGGAGVKSSVEVRQRAGKQPLRARQAAKYRE